MSIFFIFPYLTGLFYTVKGKMLFLLHKEETIVRQYACYIRHRGYLLFCCEYHKYFYKCNENISIFTSEKHEEKFECFHYTRWNFLWYSLIMSKGGVPIWGFFGPLPNLFIFGRWIAHHKCFIMVYLFSRTIIRFFELQAFKSGWGNLACHYSLFLKLILVIICVLFYQFFSLCRQRDVWNDI